MICFHHVLLLELRKGKSAIQIIFFYLSETFLGNLNDDDESTKADISVAISQDTNINEIPEGSSDTFTGVTSHVINRSRLISAQKGDPGLARLNKRAINENEARSVACCIFLRNEVLMRLPDASPEDQWLVKYQIGVLDQYRSHILNLAYDVGYLWLVI